MPKTHNEYELKCFQNLLYPYMHDRNMSDVKLHTYIPYANTIPNRIEKGISIKRIFYESNKVCYYFYFSNC